MDLERHFVGDRLQHLGQQLEEPESEVMLQKLEQKLPHAEEVLELLDVGIEHCVGF